GDLARAGFPVPNGFVLTTRAYVLAAEAAGVDPARPSEAAERLRAAPMLDAIANAARKAYAALDAERVAVRSSATAEDLPGASIDAVAGLGDKLVAGAVDPDHYAVEIASHEVVQRPPAGQGSVLSDQEVLSLAEFGDRVDRHFNAPQDIEFALDQERRVWLVQSRPITTLYPLPEDAPDPERELRV